MSNNGVTFDVVLADVEELATRGGSGSAFMAAAFVSWYRAGDTRKRDKVNLYDFERLSPQSRKVFFLMLQLRSFRNWDDEALYQTEQRIKKHWGWR